MYPAHVPKTFTLSSDFLYNKRVLLVEVQND